MSTQYSQAEQAGRGKARCRPDPPIVASPRVPLGPSTRCGAHSLSAAALVAALLVSACDRSDPVAGLDDAPERTLVQEVRLGDVDDPELGFSRPTGVAVAPDGRTLVVEGLVPEIRVLQPDGTFERRFGRRGEGPGEFASPPKIGVMRDTVWAIDPALERITLFDMAGQVRSTHRITTVDVPLPNGIASTFPWIGRDDGTFLGHMLRVSYLPPDRGGTEVAPDGEFPVPLVRFALDGTVLDTLGFAPEPPPAIWRPEGLYDLPEIDYVQDGNLRARVPAPRPLMPVRTPVPDGYVDVDPTPEGPRLRLTHVRATGDTAWVRTLTWDPVPYTDAGLDSLAARSARAAGQTPPDDWEALAERVRTRMRFPEFRPAVADAFVGDDGTLWLRRDLGDVPDARWVRITPDGDLDSQITLPASARVLWQRDDLMWVSEPDEMDIPWLVRYRISGGPGM